MNSRDGSVPTSEAAVVDPHSVLEQSELIAKLDKQTAPKIWPADVDGAIADTAYHLFPSTLLTVCVLTLKNGFTVTGESACADKGNFNAEMGRTIAHRNARDKIWAYLGFQLRTKLAAIEQAGAPTGKILELGNVTTHLGTKVIHAVKMDRLAYNTLRGWEVPADEDPTTPGYLVQYVNGGPTNVEGFDGYISWSPENVFDEAYGNGVPVKPAAPSTFLTRLEAEVKDLEERTTKLNAFIGTAPFLALDVTNRGLLEAQASIHGNLLTILSQRLSLAKAAAERSDASEPKAEAKEAGESTSK